MSNVSLKDFVAETLKGIALGVREAQEFSEKNGAVPIGLFSVSGTPTTAGEQLVKFNVFVSADASATATGTVGAAAAVISVISGKAELSGSKGSTSHSAHTIEFSVPMYFNSRWSRAETK